MKVLVVGSGGREHSLVWKIKQSPLVKKIYAAPGNAGTAEDAENVPLKAEDTEGLLKFALENKIDLTIVGPEAPLTLGIVDKFQAKGLKIFGPSCTAAELEGSKSFTKSLLKKYNIPSGFFEAFTEKGKALNYIKGLKPPYVVKADGLASGKGVIICQNIKEAEDALDMIMIKKEFGDAGNMVVVEEFLEGEEASFLAFTDGETVIPMPTSQDHKPIFDDDKGPNTGGMGAYSPAPVVTDALFNEIMNTIMIPTIRAMKSEGRTYRGVLYGGLMIKDGKARVLEFNCRFGDPECQPLLFRLTTDLVPVLLAVANGDLRGVKLEWGNEPTICVVMASGGYPGSYKKGYELKGLNEAAKVENTKVFHAGTVLKDGKIVTNGGRVLGVTAKGADIFSAIKNAYNAVEKICWDGVQYRKDIGMKAVKRLK